MLEFLQQYPFVIGALSGSLAAYLLGLIVSHLRREKRWLGFAISSRVIVERGHPDLVLTYKGRSIERLHSHAVKVRNIGNRALKTQAVRIATLDGSEIVAHELEQPGNANFSIEIPDRSTLLVMIDLLNPGEGFKVGVTVIDSSDGEIEASARGEYLVCKQMSDEANIDDLLNAIAGISAINRLMVELMRLLLKGVRP